MSGGFEIILPFLRPIAPLIQRSGRSARSWSTPAAVCSSSTTGSFKK